MIGAAPESSMRLRETEHASSWSAAGFPHEIKNTLAGVFSKAAGVCAEVMFLKHLEVTETIS